MARKSDKTIKTMTGSATPPKAEEVLSDIASKWLGSTLVRNADPRIPRDAQWLARWWIRNQEQPDDKGDRPTQHSKRDGTGTFWKTPYIDRIRHTLIKFLSLDKDFQGLIIAAAEEGIFWRGDEREFFTSVIAEHDKMKKSPNYRQEAMQKMRPMLATFGTGHRRSILKLGESYNDFLAALAKSGKTREEFERERLV